LEGTGAPARSAEGVDFERCGVALRVKDVRLWGSARCPSLERVDVEAVHGVLGGRARQCAGVGGTGSGATYAEMR
jgi:hypothetical protein